MVVGVWKLVPYRRSETEEHFNSSHSRTAKVPQRLQLLEVSLIDGLPLGKFKTSHLTISTPGMHLSDTL